MSEDYNDTEDELDYLNEYDYTEEDFDTVRKPLNVAHMKLTELWNSRTSILIRMEEIQEWFYQEINEHIFLQDMPIVLKFKAFIDLYDDYKVKWEESIEAYNKAFKDVVGVVDSKYILAKHAGREERMKLLEKDRKIRQLQHDNKTLIQDYEKQIHELSLTKDVYLKKVIEIVEDMVDTAGKVDATKLVEVLSEGEAIPEIKKIAKKMLTVDTDDKAIQEIFTDFKNAKDAGRMYSARISALKRSMAAGNMSEEEYNMNKYSLDKAKQIYDDSLQFEHKAKKGDDE